MRDIVNVVNILRFENVAVNHTNVRSCRGYNSMMGSLSVSGCMLGLICIPEAPEHSNGTPSVIEITVISTL